MTKNILLGLGLALGLVGCGGAVEDDLAGDELEAGDAQLGLITKTFNPCAGRTFDDIVPDLIAKTGSSSSCTQAVFYVANCSYVAAPASYTRFRIGTTSYHLSTPSLAPGAYATFTRPLSRSGEFTWSATADEYGAILESSEANNVTTGACIL